MNTTFRNTLIAAAMLAAPLANAVGATDPSADGDSIAKIRQALIQSCQKNPRCMAENGYRLFSTAPITFAPARTLAEYNKAFHSMQEVSEAIAAEEKLRAQSGQH